MALSRDNDDLNGIQLAVDVNDNSRGTLSNIEVVEEEEAKRR